MTPVLNEEGDLQYEQDQSSEVINDTLESHTKESQKSDDSFSAYIEHPVRESTPPRARYHHLEKREKDRGVQNVSRQDENRTRSIKSGSSMDFDANDGGDEDVSWPSMLDHGEEDDDEDDDEDEDGDTNLSQRSIVIPDMQEQEEEDGDLDASGEKKRRRRTNKAEASVLASV